jgi:hypothetical protein
MPILLAALALPPLNILRELIFLPDNFLQSMLLWVENAIVWFPRQRVEICFGDD